MKGTQRWFFLLILFVLSGCDGLPFPWPGDVQALKSSCEHGMYSCRTVCEGYDDCYSACNYGFGACVVNIDESPTTEWEPADAFYDGCKDSCSEDICSSACTAGQYAIAADSGDRIRKYGIITV